MTIVRSTILYWTNITLSKMADFGNWARKPETKARENCVGTIHKTVSECGQNPIQFVDEKYRISAEVFSMKARALQLVCLAQTESIGARK